MIAFFLSKHVCSDQSDDRNQNPHGLILTAAELFIAAPPVSPLSIHFFTLPNNFLPRLHLSTRQPRPTRPSGSARSPSRVVRPHGGGQADLPGVPGRGAARRSPLGSRPPSAVSIGIRILIPVPRCHAELPTLLCSNEQKVVIILF